MKIVLINQPFEDQGNLLELITEALGRATKLSIVVAWAKHSGLKHLEKALLDFRTSGGDGSLVIGIDEGGATKEGLQKAVQLFKKVFVFHDPEGRTFHPKMYFFESENVAHLFIGSNNLTAGGLFFNYETGFWLELDKTNFPDADVCSSVRSYIQRLISDKELYLEITSDVLQTLITDQRYRVRDERRTGGRVPLTDLDVEVDTNLDLGRESIFGKSLFRKKPIPKAIRTAQIIKRWYKHLTNSDAQQPPKKGSNVTGNMRLTQAGHSIDQTTYFRNIFFASQEWSRRKGSLEETWVIFEVSIAGESLGLFKLKVDHDPTRVSNQRNAPTFLHWGDVLGKVIRRRNYAGNFVILELLEDIKFRLDITDRSPGKFMP